MADRRAGAREHRETADCTRFGDRRRANLDLGFCLGPPLVSLSGRCDQLIRDVSGALMTNAPPSGTKSTVMGVPRLGTSSAADSVSQPSSTLGSLKRLRFGCAPRFLNHFSRFVEFLAEGHCHRSLGHRPGLQTRQIHLAEGHIHIADGGPLILAFSQNLCGGNDFLGLHPRLR